MTSYLGISTKQVRIRAKTRWKTFFFLIIIMLTRVSLPKKEKKNLGWAQAQAQYALVGPDSGQQLMAQSGIGLGLDLSQPGP